MNPSWTADDAISHPLSAVNQFHQLLQQINQNYQPAVISVYLNGINISLNTRLDVYFNETKSWCPAKVVCLSNIDMDCQSDEKNPIRQKINFQTNMNQFAPLYFYTKSHQNHKILKNEAEQ